MITDRRISTLRRRLLQEGVPAFLVTSIPNIRYLTGFEGVFDDEANVACLLTSEIARAYTDFRYAEAAKEAAEGTPWIVHTPADSIYTTICEDLHALDVEEMAVESSVPYGRFRFLSEHFGGRVHVFDQTVEKIRQVKEAAEVERIAAAAELADRTMAHVFGILGPGSVERDISLEIEVFIRKNGAEAVAFPPIVASGPNSSKPHAITTDRAMERGDLVTIDIGARLDGYCSDLTRTVVLGPASTRQREVYSAVYDANIAAIEGVRAGLRGVEIDAIARDLLVDRGFGAYFQHGLGHGVGLEVHEMPSVSTRYRESIPAGAVVTIEPGVYIPEFGGVRIEDLLVVEESGSTVLSKSPKELTEI